VLARADEVEIGTGAVCDTEKQAERLASLVTDGAEVALQTVNAEEHDATACEVLTVAFVRGTRVGLVRTKDVTMEIVEILVLGVAPRAVSIGLSPPSIFRRSTSRKCELSCGLPTEDFLLPCRGRREFIAAGATRCPASGPNFCRRLPASNTRRR